jgi:AcrR family transcriptional regulator
MVQITFKGSEHIRVEQILEAASHRFGIYGYEKTTMREIAKDLRISKGSLYYYFPDKENLYKAIFVREHNLFMEAIRAEIGRLVSAADMLEKFVITRLELFRSLINLAKARLDPAYFIQGFMKDIILRNRQQELEFLTEILETGIKNGEFVVSDPVETADLLIDLLKGLRQIMLKEPLNPAEIDDAYKVVEKKTRLLINLYIQAIRIK